MQPAICHTIGVMLFAFVMAFVVSFTNNPLLSTDAHLHHEDLRWTKQGDLSAQSGSNGRVLLSEPALSSSSTQEEDGTNAQLHYIPSWSNTLWLYAQRLPLRLLDMARLKLSPPVSADSGHNYYQETHDQPSSQPSMQESAQFDRDDESGQGMHCKCSCLDRRGVNDAPDRARQHPPSQPSGPDDELAAQKAAGQETDSKQ